MLFNTNSSVEHDSFICTLLNGWTSILIFYHVQVPSILLFSLMLLLMSSCVLQLPDLPWIFLSFNQSVVVTCFFLLFSLFIPEIFCSSWIRLLSYYNSFSYYYFIPLRVFHTSVSWWCPWCNGYCRRKWTWRHEFKSWTRLIAFHILLIPLGKVWIQLFSL